MIITKILGNIHDDPSLITRHTEKITLVDAALVKRIQRVHSDHNTEVGLRLPSGHPPLRDGDVLFSDGDNSIVIYAAPTDILRITPQDMKEMAFVAHSLGNRHLPAQFSEDALIVQFDSTVVDFLEHHSVAYVREAAVMPQPFRHAEHTH
ncbi:urease accessory protein UreE [Corynebacterium callunae]|uniref:urease accessory protein UreE n=1 Tax=Corynebacterium callunae TaxID=1721 RepID=UPI0039819A37